MGVYNCIKRLSRVPTRVRVRLWSWTHGLTCMGQFCKARAELRSVLELKLKFSIFIGCLGIRSPTRINDDKSFYYGLGVGSVVVDLLPDPKKSYQTLHVSFKSGAPLLYSSKLIFIFITMVSGPSELNLVLVLTNFIRFW